MTRYPQVVDLLIANMASQVKAPLMAADASGYARSAKLAGRIEANADKSAQADGKEAAMQTTGASLTLEPTSMRRAESHSTAARSTKDAATDDFSQDSLRKTPSESTIRAERLARIRAQIAAGVYDTPERLEAAVDKLFGVLNQD
jgi:anti-sigma28 factor (negative regulator of flagellin synthesis)